MNADDQKKLLELYKQKRDYVAAILKMTEERTFSVVEEDVERFFNFFQKRAVLFENCKGIDEKISKLNVTEKDKKSFFYKDVEKINNEIKELASKVIVIDKKNKITMEKLMNLIKDNIRNLKVSKQVQQGYGDYFFQGEAYGIFDSSK